MASSRIVPGKMRNSEMVHLLRSRRQVAAAVVRGVLLDVDRLRVARTPAKESADRNLRFEIQVLEHALSYLTRVGGEAEWCRAENRDLEALEAVCDD